jgi:hypothetical protein
LLIGVEHGFAPYARFEVEAGVGPLLNSDSRLPRFRIRFEAKAAPASEFDLRRRLPPLLNSI